MRLSRIIAYFFTSSFIGWVIDSAFRSWLAHSFVSGSFFPIPLCPIYGVGVLLILGLHHFLKSTSIVIEWVVLGIVLGTMEAVTGEVILSVFHRNLWNYPSGVLAVSHFTNLAHMILWGTLGVIFARYLEPAISSNTLKKRST